MTSFRHMLFLLVLSVLAVLSSCTASAQETEKTQGMKQPGSSVFVDPISLTQVTERILTGLRLGAAVIDQSTADGIQEAADVWGLHVDLFRLNDQRQVSKIAEELMQNGAAVLLWKAFRQRMTGRLQLPWKMRVTAAAVGCRLSLSGRVAYPLQQILLHLREPPSTMALLQCEERATRFCR